MRTAVSWYKNISKINKEEAFTHAHAVHRSYGRGTLPDLIDKRTINIGTSTNQKKGAVGRRSVTKGRFLCPILHR